MKKHYFYLIPLFILTTFCTKSYKNNEILDRKQFPHSKTFGFRYRHIIHPNTLLSEASGICLSSYQKDFVWIHNDSQGENALFLVNPKNGIIKGKMSIEGISNRDWEDLCSYYDSNTHTRTIYIADIGDNQNIYSTKYIYEIEEPKLPSYDHFNIRTKVTHVRKFFYPKNPHQDAESIFISPKEQKLYIINKTTTRSKLYSLDLRQKSNTATKASFECEIPLNYITSADFNPKRNWLILRNYNDIFLWKKNNTAFKKLFETNPIRLVNKYEPQAEGICWNENATGYFTIHEQGKGMPVGVSFYQEIKQNEDLLQETSTMLEAYDN